MSTVTASSDSTQRPVGPAFVARVALGDRRRDLLVAQVGDLLVPPLRPHLGIGGEVHLELGVGEHDRTDVAALDDASPSRPRPTPADADASRSARRDSRRRRSPRGSPRGRGSRCVASTPSTNTPFSLTSSSRSFATRATCIASPLGSMPRRSAANATPRYIAPVSRYSRSRRFGEGSGDGRLARSGRPVDGDHAHRSVTLPGRRNGAVQARRSSRGRSC